MHIEIVIQNGGAIQIPVTEDNIKLTWERKGTPGKLTFTVLKSDGLDFQEGNPVKLLVDGKPLFSGFVFQKKRDKNRKIDVVAYDQLRYLKNKDTVIDEGVKASALLKRLAKTFRLETGEIADTGYVLETIVEENQTLFDIIQKTLDETMMHTKQLFVLYDAVGKLTLQNINTMKLDFLIDAQSAENFRYETSIDSQTYNKINLAYPNKKTGTLERFVAQDGENINRWGVLQYFEQIQTTTGAPQKADTLLQLYDNKTRKLSVQKAFGDVRVRAGTTIAVSLHLGDMVVNQYMMVEKVTHIFSAEQHTMDLDLIGGTFIG